MKILVINQHSQNHGDEAAGKALLRTLYDRGFEDITVSYNMPCTTPAAFFFYQSIKQLSPRFYLKGTARILRFCLRHWSNPVCRCLPLFFPRLMGDRRAIAQSDVVINAPGGVNLGLYEDVIYLWRLMICRELKKKLIIYSPSIGPFSPKSYFTRLSTEVLSHAVFLSLRDPQSGRYAKELGIAFTDSIDTAYLEKRPAQIPESLAAQLGKNYVVLVPHQLYKWHPGYRRLSSAKLDGFYRELISRFSERADKIVLLPQIFCHEALSDERYFRELAADFPEVVIVPQHYDSDIQQQIIGNAQFVVGARYHTIVFAVNNSTPFFSIAYEHKMTNMLERLQLSDYTAHINDILSSPVKYLQRITAAYENREHMQPILEKAGKKAQKIARETFEKMVKYLS